MLDSAFRQPISMDQAPEGNHCAWCGKLAVYQLMVPCQTRQHEETCFCQTCSEEFARTVADTLDRMITVEAGMALPV